VLSSRSPQVVDDIADRLSFVMTVAGLLPLSLV